MVDETQAAPDVVRSLDPVTSDEPDEFWEDEPDESDELASEESDTPTESEESPAPDGTDASEQPDASAAPAAQQPNTPSSQTPSEDIKPFSFRVDGKEVAPKGAVRVNGFIAFPEETWNRDMHNLLADRGEIRRREAALQKQLADRDPEKHPDVQKSRELLKSLDALMSAPEDQLVERILTIRDQWPVLQANARAAILQRQLDERNGQVSEREQQESRAEWEPRLKEGLDARIQTVLEMPEFKSLGLKPGPLAKKMWRLGQGAFVEKEDGQVYVNDEALLEFIEADAEQIREFRAAADAEKARDAARARNAAALSKGGQKAPPTVSAKGSPSTGSHKQTFKNKEEYQEFMRKYRKSEIDA